MPSFAATHPAAPATERFERAVVRTHQAPAVALMASMAPVEGGVGGVVVAPQARAAEMLKPAQQIGAREFEQAPLMIADRSLRKGLAKHGRI